MTFPEGGERCLALRLGPISVNLDGLDRIETFTLGSRCEMGEIGEEVRR